MRNAHRLVGWWLVGLATALSPRAVLAQSTATFPEEPAPGKAPAPAPPAAPRAPAPSAAPPAPSLPVESPYGAEVQPAPRLPELPAPGRDTRPPILPYEDGLPVPAGYEVVDRPVTGLITAGAIGMATSYGAGVVVAATQGFKNGTVFLTLPILGPWIAVATRKYECTNSTKNVAEAKQCVNAAVGEVQLITFMAVDGIAQLATGFVMVAGLVSKKKALLRTDLLPAEVSLVPPGPAHDGWGFSARGKF
ncbi:MAG TPA: hypothetical protein VGK73_05910 [Polyangiaceae bacterium]